MKSFRSACYVPCTYRVKLLMTLIAENQLHPKDNSQTIFLNGIYEYEDLDDRVAFCSRFMLILQQPLSLLIKPQSACCSVWVSGAGVAARFFLRRACRHVNARGFRNSQEMASLIYCTRQRHTCTFIAVTRSRSRFRTKFCF